MQIALESFADQANPQNEKLIILLLDRAGWHVSSKLKVPKNIIMYPISAYTPRLNPTECIWPLLRESLANKPLNDLDELENILVKRCNWLMNNSQIVKGAAGFKWLSNL